MTTQNSNVFIAVDYHRKRIAEHKKFREELDPSSELYEATTQRIRENEEIIRELSK